MTRSMSSPFVQKRSTAGPTWDRRRRFSKRKRLLLALEVVDLHVSLEHEALPVGPRADRRRELLRLRIFHDVRARGVHAEREIHERLAAVVHELVGDAAGWER